MRTLKESLLDDEDEVMNRMGNDMLDPWMDEHSTENSLWLDRNYGFHKKRWKKLKDGYQTSDPLGIDMRDEDNIPSHVNFDGPMIMCINTNSKKLNINSKYLKNIKKFEIYGPNLLDVQITTPINSEFFSISGPNIKIINADKCKIGNLFINGCPKLDVFKSHLPAYEQIYISQEIKNSLYDYVKKTNRNRFV